MKAKLNRKQLQSEISEMYKNYTIVFVESIPNGEIDQILRKRTLSLEIVHDSMIQTIESYNKNN
jgi:hypothetical protein